MTQVEQARTPLGQLIGETPKIDPARFTAEFMALAQFRERGKRFQFVRDIFRVFKRGSNGKTEDYLHTFDNAAKKTGRAAAAVYGDAKIGGKDVVLFAMDWDFIRGSFGELEGEKFIDAAINYAAPKNRDVVAIVPSAGARQQESVAALMQIPRMVYALGELKRKSLLYIPVHIETFGGLSVSIAYGDLTIGVKGKRSGFSGPALIRSYERVEPLPEDQSTEQHFLNGTIDYLVDDAQDLYNYLKKFFKVARNRRRNRETDRVFLRPMMDQIVLRRRVESTYGCVSMLNDSPATEKDADIVQPAEALSNQLSLADWVQKLSFNPRRIDMEDILRNGVDDVVPLSMRWRLPGSDRVEYHDVYGAIGRIGKQSFLLVGNQPSYYITGNETRKLPSSPERRDTELLIRYYKLGDLLGLDCVNFCSTPGSPATRRTEKEGIARSLFEGIAAGLNYRGRMQTIILDILGSGGGLLTGVFGDHFSILRKAVMCVASPQYMSIILSKSRSPEDVKLTAETARITAPDLLEMGIVDDIIPEPEGGAEANPTRMIEMIRDHIFRVSVKLNQKSLKQILEERGKRILGLHIMHIEPVKSTF